MEAGRGGVVERRHVNHCSVDTTARQGSVDKAARARTVSSPPLHSRPSRPMQVRRRFGARYHRTCSLPLPYAWLPCRTHPPLPYTCVTSLSVPCRYDAEYGGFGGPPKFPRPCEIQLMLRAQDRLRVRPRGQVAGYWLTGRKCIGSAMRVGRLGLAGARTPMCSRVG